MCIFTQPVISVNNTQIFARKSGNGTQFLAYQMSYESTVPNAMILPVPIKQPARETHVRFINLENYESFFKDLNLCFPFHSRPSIGCSSSAAIGTDLRVFKVGNYIASFVPTLADFDRLDSQFILPIGIWEKIPNYSNFGFAVFQLASGKLKPHPMAFEYQTDHQDLFFPTVHIHDGAIHESEEFDHVLYMQHAGLDSLVYGYDNADIADKATGLVRSKYPAGKYCNVAKSNGLINGDLLIHRNILRGEFANKDILIAAPGDPLTPTLNIRPWMSYFPWLVALGAIGWFFNRRSKLKKRQNQMVGSNGD